MRAAYSGAMMFQLATVTRRSGIAAHITLRFAGRSGFHARRMSESTVRSTTPGAREAQVVYFIVARPAIGLFFGEGARGVPEATAREFGSHAGEFAVRALEAK